MTKKNIFFTIIGLLLIVVVIVGIKTQQIVTLIETDKKWFEPPVFVSSFIVEPVAWESTLTAIGSLEAAKGLEITADVSGRITRIHFEAGAEVSAGDILLEQDTSTEKAQLRAAQSEVVLEKNNFFTLESSNSKGGVLNLFSFI